MNNWGIIVVAALVPVFFSCHRVGSLDAASDGSPEGEGSSEGESEILLPSGEGLELVPINKNMGEIVLRRSGYYAQETWSFFGRFGEWETVPDFYNLPLVDIRTTPDGTTCHIYHCEGEYCSEGPQQNIYVGGVTAYSEGYPDTELFELQFEEEGDYYSGLVCGFTGDASAPCPDWVYDDVHFTVEVEGNEEIPGFEAVNRIPQETPVIQEPSSQNASLYPDSYGNYYIAFSSGEADQVELGVVCSGEGNGRFLLFPDEESGEVYFPGDWLEEFGCAQNGSLTLDAVNITEVSGVGYSILVKAINSVWSQVQFH